MSWLQILHLAISAAVCVLVFRWSDDEPFWLRCGMALVVALFWPVMLVIFAIWMIGDGVVGLRRMLRK